MAKFQHTIMMYAWACFALAMSASFIGCQTMKAPEIKMPWKKDKEKEAKAQLPDRILTIWSDTVLHQPGESGVRGFGGRIYFYKEEGDDPIEVDGGMIVYAFDGEDYDPSNPAPIKRFVFTPDQFVSHHSKTSMGHSYSVWLPWDKVGGPTRSISLVARFEGRHGGVVISDSVNKMLPGVGKQNDDESAARDDQDYGVRQAGYNEGTRDRDSILERDMPQRERPATMTIDLPPQFNRHLYPAAGESESQTQSSSSKESAASKSSASESAEMVGEDLPLSYDAYLKYIRNRDAEQPAGDDSTSSAATGREARSELHKYPARTMPGSPTSPSPVRRQPHRAGWLSELPPTPRSGVNARPRSPFATAPEARQDQRP